MDKKFKTTGMGVRGRLLLAFTGICMFSLLAAGSGFFSLSQVGGSLKQITEQRVPEALSWLELSRQVEGVVRAAPAVLLVSTEEKRIEVSNEISLQATKLIPLLERSKSFQSDESETADDRVEQLVIDLTGNLASLNDLVKKRLTIVEISGMLVKDLSQANKIVLRTLAPGARILDSKIAGWNINRGKGIPEEVYPKRIELADQIVELIPQNKAAVLADAIHNNFLKITTSETAESIDVLLFPLKKSIVELSNIAESVPNRVKGRLVKQVGIIENLVEGPNSISQARKDELAIIADAEKLLRTNALLSKSLTNKIKFLVDRANTVFVAANVQAAETQTLNTNVLIGIVTLSLFSSILIVWLYVGRNLIVRLTALSDSMLALAGGNLRAPLPEPGGNDEIARMAKALIGFRDTALEVEEARKREISGIRKRLTDAIESISEGFSLYDSDDRLVICNNQYRSLLYPGKEELIVPGVTFEEVIRRAVEIGLIETGDDRMEDWIHERLVRHRDPGEPITYRRSNKQWIQVSERLTDDGGTVAIYTDLTAIKDSEEELGNSKKRFHELFENAPIAIFEEDWSGIQREVERLKRKGVTDLKRYFAEHPEFVASFSKLVQWRDFNPAAVQLYGAKDTASLREHLMNTEDTYSWDVYADGVIAFDRGERHFSQEVIEETVDGREITIVFTCQLGENISDWSSVTTTSLDITERRRFQLALEESEERYVLSMRGSNEGLWDWDKRKDEIFISPHIKTLLGLEITDHDYIAPEVWEARIHPEDQDTRLEAQRAHFAGETEFNVSEYRVRDKDETYRWVLDRGAGLKDSDGKIYRMAGSVGDISERKRAEQELSTKSNALEQLSNQLAKYLSPQIYDSIFSGKQEVKLVSQRKRLTIFFSDLVGFTSTTEKLESEDLTRLLNQYLTEMSQIAFDHGATIDKYIGDAIVIFFGDPETLGIKEDALACVKMAIAMRKRMKELESVWKDSGLEEPLRCRMGINTGICTVGNFGSDDRMDYTIIGSGVNLAARLETACEANEILISFETYAHVKDDILCDEREKISAKGFAKPIATYQVVDLYNNLDDRQRPISQKLPHARLDVDVNLMSTKERKEAAKMLLEAVERLSEKPMNTRTSRQKTDAN